MAYVSKETSHLAYPAEKPLPSLDEIAKKPEFDPKEINKQEFEKVWERAIGPSVRIIRMKSIIGSWKAEHNPFDPNEELFLQFDPSGKLTQATKKGGEQQIIFLTYRLEDGLLVTDQPSSPRIQKTKMRLDGDKLVLKYNDVTAVFNRVSEQY